MAHGAPDASDVVKQTVIDRVDDLGELAARLGAIPSFDRRGEWMFAENFALGYGIYYGSTSGVGASVSRVQLPYLSGGYAVKLVGATAGGGYAYIGGATIYPDFSKLGMEALVALEAGQDVIRLVMDITDDDTQYHVGLEYDPSDQELRYASGLAAWTAFATSVVLNSSALPYHSFKIVANLVGQLYVRAIVDGVEYDLSTLSVPTGASSVGRYLAAYVYSYDLPAAQSIAYVDSIILTRNEP